MKTTQKIQMKTKIIKQKQTQSKMKVYIYNNNNKSQKQKTQTQILKEKNQTFSRERLSAGFFQ